jgi:WD40 repeat protein
VLALCYTPDGKFLVSAGVDQTVRVWDVESGRAVRSLDNHAGPVRALALRPGQPGDAPPMVASAGSDRTVRLWQPTIGRMVRFAKLPGDPLALAWTNDGNRLLAVCVDGQLHTLDPDTVQVVQSCTAIKGCPHTLAIAPHGSGVLVGGQDGLLKRIELPSAK